MRKFPAATVAATLALSALLSGCAGFAAKPAKSEIKLGRYVAMGSAMASGPGGGPVKPGTPARCTRTFGNYPTLLAETLRLTLVDVSCTAAAAPHVIGPWKELPAQVDAVTPDTKLVTLSIGGSDINYVGGLFAATCGEGDTIDIGGLLLGCPARKAPTEEDFTGLEENLRKIAREVKKRAPKSKLVFVQYPQLVPETLCDATPLSPEDAEEGRKLAERLAEITSRVARQSGSLLVPAHEWSAGHTPCDAEPYVSGNPQGRTVTDGAPWHYNRAGMEKTAEWIAYVLGE